MSILRWLFLAFLAWVAYRMWQRYKMAKQTPHVPLTKPPTTPTPAIMVKCVHCDLHIPQQQAITNGEQWFCCIQHKNEFISQ